MKTGFRGWVALALLGAFPSLQAADADKRCSGDTLGGECGYFWGADFGAPTPAPTPTPQPVPEDPPVEVVENRCDTPETWSPPCGFIDPQGDWAFQNRMGEELIRRMAMNSTDPSAVKEYQRYAFWAVRQAAQVAQMWMYNITQDPELQPGIAHYPVSQFGTQMAAKNRRGYEEEIYATLRDENAFFVYFSRADCFYCREMNYGLDSLKKSTGLPVYNAALDEQCMPGYTGEFCVKGQDTQDPAARLKVTVVPTIFLHMPQTDTWIRLSTGLEDTQTIKMRIRLFAMASRAAAIKGMESTVDGQAPVDFTQRGFTFGDTGNIIIPEK